MGVPGDRHPYFFIQRPTMEEQMPPEILKAISLLAELDDSSEYYGNIPDWMDEMDDMDD
jgi:hypothetical protein